MGHLGSKGLLITFFFRKIDKAQEICFLIGGCTYFSIENEQFPMLFGQIIATSHDLTPKWWFSKGKQSSVGEERVVKYLNLARLLCWSTGGYCKVEENMPRSCWWFWENVRWRSQGPSTFHHTRLIHEIRRISLQMS